MTAGHAGEGWEELIACSMLPLLRLLSGLDRLISEAARPESADMAMA